MECNPADYKVPPLLWIPEVAGQYGMVGDLAIEILYFAVVVGCYLGSVDTGAPRYLSAVLNITHRALYSRNHSVLGVATHQGRD